MKVRLTGTVVKKNNSSASVMIERKVKHKIYGKQYKISKKVHVFDPENTLQVGQTVLIEETRPISKNIHWKIADK